MFGPGSGDRIDTSSGVDVDHDGRPDTVLLPDLGEPVLAVDLDRDGLADLLVRVDPDGLSHSTALDPAGLAHTALDPLPLSTHALDPLSLDPLAPDPCPLDLWPG